ncbi:MAG: hypothetical protein V4719_21435 [Planctomycetota bacterium]
MFHYKSARLWLSITFFLIVSSVIAATLLRLSNEDEVLKELSRRGKTVRILRNAGHKGDDGTQLHRQAFCDYLNIHPKWLFPINTIIINHEYLSDGDVDLMSQLTSLEYVNVADSEMSEKSFVRLAHFPKLYEIHAQGTKVPAAAIEKCRGIRTTLEIYFD